MLHPPAPPYAVSSPTFRFPALASLAGRLPIGSGRETVLAALLTARVAMGCLPGAAAQGSRVARAAATKQWLTAMCPDAKVRAACAALADSTTGADPAAVSRALLLVMEITAPRLDAGARSELASLAAELQR